MRKLDRIDQQILDILQRDGRIAISELASRVNLSTTPCSGTCQTLRARRYVSWVTTHASIHNWSIETYWCF